MKGEIYHQKLFMNSKQIKIAIYTRVSTIKQNDNTSKKTQLESILKYIDEHDELRDGEKIYYDDTSSASKNPKDGLVARDGMNRLLQDAYSKKFEYLICYSHDRFTRNIDEFIIIQRTIRLLGIKIIYTKAGENVNSDNDGLNSLFENLMNNLSALEANIISSRVKLANKYKASNGKWTGGTAPYGYSLIPSFDNPKHSVLCINEIEANIVREIFRMYSKGYNNYEIADFINKTYYFNKSKVWTHNTIKNIIRNPVYTGRIVWNKKGGVRNPVRHSKEEYIYSVKEKSKEIISERLWDDVVHIREILAENSKFLSTDFLVNNFLYCGVCGKELKAKNYGKEKRYYYCEEKHISLNSKALDKKVIETVTVLVGNTLELEDKFEEFYNRYMRRLNEINASNSKHINKLQDDINRNEEAKKGAQEKISYMQKSVKQNGEVYGELIDALKEQKIKWEIENEMFKDEINKKYILKIIDKEELRKTIELRKKDVLEIFNRSCENGNKKRELRVLFSKILFRVIVFENEELDIIFK